MAFRRLIAAVLRAVHEPIPLRFCLTFGITLEKALNSLRNAFGTGSARAWGHQPERMTRLPAASTAPDGATFSRVQFAQTKAV